MIASLPMYDRPETAEANNRYWTAIRDHLTEGPDGLTREGDLWEQWLNPDLILSQTCGYPYRAHLHGRVRLVGTPNYALPDCPPGYYNSVIVVKADDPRKKITEFETARFAFNEALSQSGWAAPQTFAATKGFQFSNVIATGGHLHSARAVAENRADIASIDGLTWKMLQRYDDFTKKLRVIERTSPTPALPYITALGRDAVHLFGAVRSAIKSLSTDDQQTLQLFDLVAISPGSYLDVPTPAPPHTA